MGPWIQQAKNKLFAIIEQTKKDVHNLELRVAYIGYAAIDVADSARACKVQSLANLMCSTLEQSALYEHPFPFMISSIYISDTRRPGCLVF